jgi:hypothetical protein
VTATTNTVTTDRAACAMNCVYEVFTVQAFGSGYLGNVHLFDVVLFSGYGPRIRVVCSELSTDKQASRYLADVCNFLSLP